MTREEAKTEIMQIYGSLSEEKKMALDVLMAQEDGEHDGCKDCVYQANPQDAMPCRECKQNYMDMWKAIPSTEPKTGHWILDETDNSITCDKCGCLIWANDISNGEAYFCPNCGAKMD